MCIIVLCAFVKSVLLLFNCYPTIIVKEDRDNMIKAKEALEHAEPGFVTASTDDRLAVVVEELQDLKVNMTITEKIRNSTSVHLVVIVYTQLSRFSSCSTLPFFTTDWYLPTWAFFKR